MNKLFNKYCFFPVCVFQMENGGRKDVMVRILAWDLGCVTDSICVLSCTLNFSDPNCKMCRFVTPTEVSSN